MLGYAEQNFKSNEEEQLRKSLMKTSRDKRQMVRGNSETDFVPYLDQNEKRQESRDYRPQHLCRSQRLMMGKAQMPAACAESRLQTFPDSLTPLAIDEVDARYAYLAYILADHPIVEGRGRSGRGLPKRKVGAHWFFGFDCLAAALSS